MGSSDTERIAAIYDAALEDEAWERLPALLGQWLDADSVVLWYRQPDHGFGGAASNLPRESLTLYETRFAAIDPWGNAARERGMIGQVFLGTDVVSESAFRQTEFYWDFARYIGTTQMVGAGKLFSSGAMMVCAAHRPFGVTSFGSRQKQLLEEISPHIARAVRMRMLIGDRDTRGLAESALSCLHAAIAVCDACGVARYANAEAMAIAGRANLKLELNGEPIRTEFAAETKDLREAIAAVSTTDAITTRILHRHNCGPLYVTMRPLKDRLGRVLLMFGEAHPPTALNREALTSLFGLTAAEADVALAIIAGSSVGEICRSRCVSENTVRTQIAVAMQKLGVRNQRELLVKLRPASYLRPS